ncbi:putative ER to Golgi transport-related protein [Atractiella rhizophila]|nr:putative ER to Golgi transport-related protein [Atractiella rhizophila]
MATRRGQQYQAPPSPFPTSPYHTSINPNFGPPPAEGPLETVKQFTSKVEDLIDFYGHPVKPYVPGLGRFLIIVTFLEDALRIITQWGDQLYFLQRHRNFPWGLSHLFLTVNVVAMLAGSFFVVRRQRQEIAVGALLAVVIAQGFGYGLIFDLNFFLRNLSVVGGLLMVLSDSLSKNRSLFAGIPSLELNESDRRKYFQLAGRILLIFLFIGFVINGKLTLFKIFVSLIGLVACVMVAVGFKAKFSAVFLVLLLSMFNILINNFWSVHKNHPQRDFLKYDFFQTLSIVGGLMLLANMGAGGFSVDERKKNF